MSAHPPAHRFGDPHGIYRVCYLGASLEASFAESLLRTPPRRLLSLGDLAKRSVTTFRLTRGVRLVRMEGSGLNHLGLTASEAHGAYDVCGRWARAIWEHGDEVDGIFYRSRHDNGELCVALFDRATQAIEEVGAVGLADDRRRLPGLVQRYGVKLTR